MGQQLLSMLSNQNERNGRLKDINFREKGFKDLTLMLLGSSKWEHFNIEKC